jgi:hypothetical protein
VPLVAESVDELPTGVGLSAYAESVAGDAGLGEDEEVAEAPSAARIGEAVTEAEFTNLAATEGDVA